MTTGVDAAGTSIAVDLTADLRLRLAVGGRSTAVAVRAQPGGPIHVVVDDPTVLLAELVRPAVRRLSRRVPGGTRLVLWQRDGRWLARISWRDGRPHRSLSARGMVALARAGWAGRRAVRGHDSTPDIHPN